MLSPVLPSRGSTVFCKVTIWLASGASIANARAIVPPTTTEKEPAYTSVSELRSRKQTALDALANYVRAIKTGNSAIRHDVAGATRISRARWIELQNNDFLLGLAHLECLPEGKIRTQFAAGLHQLEAVLPRTTVRQAYSNLRSYLRASIEFSPGTAKALVSANHLSHHSAPETRHTAPRHRKVAGSAARIPQV